MRGQLLRLGGNALVYGVGQVLSRFISFLLLPLFTRELTPTDYGVTAILGLLTMFASTVFALGFGTSLGVVYFDGESRERRPQTIWTAVMVLAASAVALLLVGVIASGALASALFESSPGYDLPGLIGLAVAATAVGIVVQPFLLYLQFEGRARMFLAVTVSTTLASTTLAVVAVVGLQLGVPGLLAANLIGQCTTLVIAALPALRELPIRIRPAIARDLLRLGLPIIPAFGFLFVMQQANKYLLQLDAGLDVVGIYTIGFNLGLFMTIVVGGFTTAWYPFFLSYMTRPEEGRRIFGRVMTYYVIGFGIVDIAFFASARAVVSHMTQPAFHDASLAVGFSAAAQYLVGIFSIALVGMYFAKEVKYLALVQGAAALVSVVSAVVLIRLFGILGAAASLLIGHLAMVGFQLGWNRARGYLEIPYDTRRIGLFLVIHVVAAAVALWPRTTSPGTEIWLAGLIVLAAAVATAALLTSAERRALSETLVDLRSRLPAGRT